MAGRPISTPVTVLTGFLGAGKTTVLNRILSGDHGLRIAVLVNDFGALNIDSDLVVGVESDGDLISLANGCVCCNVRDDLLEAVMQVIERPERPDFIVLEASGVAEPSGIVLTFGDPQIRDQIRLDGIVCVMDASQIFAAPELMELKLRQIAFADMLVLNKTDLVGRADIDDIRAWLDDRFWRYRLVESVRGEVPLDVLLSADQLEPTDELNPNRLDVAEHDCGELECGHDAMFSSWSYETSQPLSLPALRDAAKKLPAGIYRCKGVVHSDEPQGRRWILHVVGKRVDLEPDGEWGPRAPRTRIVAIGARGAIDAGQLHAVFDRCTVPGTARLHSAAP